MRQNDLTANSPLLLSNNIKKKESNDTSTAKPFLKIVGKIFLFLEKTNKWGKYLIVFVPDTISSYSSHMTSGSLLNGAGYIQVSLSGLFKIRTIHKVAV